MNKLSTTPAHNADPTARVGNRKVRNILRTATTVATLALAACSPGTSRPDAAPQPAVAAASPTPESTTTTTSPEQNKEALRAKVQTTAEGMATRVIDEYQKSKSPHNYIYDPKDGSSLGVNTLYNTETVVGGAYGEYGLVASVKRDAQGNLDPKTVDMVSVFENINVAGKEVAKNPGDRVNLYGFMLLKDGNSGDWTVLVDQTNKGGAEPTLRCDTSAPEGLPGSYAPLTTGQFDALTAQANTVFDWAVEQAPVNYPPAA